MAKEIDQRQVLDYLRRAFEKASEPFGPRSRAVKGSKLYEFQCDFAYLIHEMDQCPPYMLPKVIQRANDLIKLMEEEAAEFNG
jgi:hypothetical protein